jgi:Ni/Co efflux regulator RcnB
MSEKRTRLSIPSRVKIRQQLPFGAGNMRRTLILVLAVPFALSAFSAAQAGSLSDLRADEQRLRQQELQLDRDRDRLTVDRRAHASRGQIQADEAQIRRDRAEIKRLRADIKRDRRIRRSYRARY